MLLPLKKCSKANPAAWEWWNTPPAGFAYEWTHPPLAKLGMVLGLKILGNSPTGWRFPGAILEFCRAYCYMLFAINYLPTKLFR